MKLGPRSLEKKTIPQLKATADKECSIFVRLKYSENGYCECYTCGKSLPLGDSNLNAGHFVSRVYGPTRYDWMRNIRPQCFWPCNNKMQGNGRPLEFEKRLEIDIGKEEVCQLKKDAASKFKYDRFDLIEKIEFFREQIKDLKRG